MSSVYRTDELMPEPGGDGVPWDDGPDNEGPGRPRRSPCPDCGNIYYEPDLGRCFACRPWTTTKATNR